MLHIIEYARKSLLENTNFYLDLYKVDLFELGKDDIRGSMGEDGYRDLRPWDCCGGLPPDEELEWHVYHINNCLNYDNHREVIRLCQELVNLIKRKGEKLKIKKDQTIERIKTKDITKTCFSFTKHAIPIYDDCLNSKQLEKKEREITKEIEQLSLAREENERLSRLAREDKEKKNAEENERIIKEQEKKYQEQSDFWHLNRLITNSPNLTTLEQNYQIVQNSPLYTNSKKTFPENERNNKDQLDWFYNISRVFFNDKRV